MHSVIGIILLMFVSLTIQLSLPAARFSLRIKRQSYCTEAQFECESRQCVDMDGFCDGRTDCEDGSDETSEKCPSVPCPDFAYRCSYGGCVSKQSKCNGIRDCRDGSDETECPTTSSTPTIPQHRSGCLMPAHPQRGRFRTLDGSSTKPNNIVGDYTVITGSCNEGFTPIMAGAMFCLNKRWIPEIPEQFCEPTDRFTTDSGAVLKTSDYKSTADTLYRKFDDTRVHHKQIVNVLNVRTFQYSERSQQFVNDIALTKLQTYFRLPEYIKPVRLDQFNDDDLVVGWGHESDTPTRQLATFRTEDAGQKEVKGKLENGFYANDKICAGNIENSTRNCSDDNIVTGDSSGGLYILSVDLFHVRGILSISSPSTSSICSSNHSALFNNVSSHTSWMLDAVKAISM